ncbi:amino acid ABC transporter substrate-binding protein [Pseudomonadota bacterium]
MKNIIYFVGVLALFATAATQGRAAQTTLTLEHVRDRGFVSCGVTDRMPGFSAQNADGSWSGFNVDFCTALGAAIFADPQAVKVSAYWLDALEGEDIDVLHAGSTWTYTRDTTRNIEFPGINFYDGQGFIAHAHIGAKTLKEAMALDGVKVCAISPTSTALSNLQDFMVKNDVKWQVAPVQTMDGMWRAFFGGRCHMAIHDRSALAAVHAGRLDDSSDFVVFPEVISKEPLAPAVRGDDLAWRDLVSWVTLVTISAEELGITQANVDQMKATTEVPEARRLLGVEPGLGKGLGLNDDWAYQVIKAVGNYGEIFDRNLGVNSKFKMSRGLNSLWRDGGLLYAPPVR